MQTDCGDVRLRTAWRLRLGVRRQAKHDAALKVFRSLFIVIPHATGKPFFPGIWIFSGAWMLGVQCSKLDVLCSEAFAFFLFNFLISVRPPFHQPRNQQTNNHIHHHQASPRPTTTMKVYVRIRE
jgi:hypothetical protein